MSFSAPRVLGCREQIATVIEHTIRNKSAAGWSAEDIANYLTTMNPDITTDQVRRILALPR